MNLHRKTNHSTNSTASLASSSSANLAEKPSGTLSTRLTTTSGENLDILPRDLMKKYIAYARKYVHPKLNAEACQIIQEFYMELRTTHQRSDATPMTTRQLESLIRLTQARTYELEDCCRDFVYFLNITISCNVQRRWGESQVDRQNGVEILEKT